MERGRGGPGHADHWPALNATLVVGPGRAEQCIGKAHYAGADGEFGLADVRPRSRLVVSRSPHLTDERDDHDGRDGNDGTDCDEADRC
jgi:hypothetical protein